LEQGQIEEKEASEERSRQKLKKPRRRLRIVQVRLRKPHWVILAYWADLKKKMEGGQTTTDEPKAE
jgi:hypothetical protein